MISTLERDKEELFKDSPLSGYTNYFDVIKYRTSPKKDFSDMKFPFWKIEKNYHKFTIMVFFVEIF